MFFHLILRMFLAKNIVSGLTLETLKTFFRCRSPVGSNAALHLLIGLLRCHEGRQVLQRQCIRQTSRICLLIRPRCSLLLRRHGCAECFSDRWRVSKPGQVFRTRGMQKTHFLQKQRFSGVMTPPFSVEFLKSWVLWQAKIEKALCLRRDFMSKHSLNPRARA